MENIIYSDSRLKKRYFVFGASKLAKIANMTPTFFVSNNFDMGFKKRRTLY